MALRSGNRRRPRLAPVVLAALALGACPAPPDSPEAQIRALLAEAEGLAEEKDAAGLKRLVSERYADASGNDRQAIVGLLTYYFLRHQTVRLLTRTHAIDFPEPRRSTVTVFAAMGGTPSLGVDELARVRADLYRFDFELADEGEGTWRVTRAGWRRAKTADFVP